MLFSRLAGSRWGARLAAVGIAFYPFPVVAGDALHRAARLDPGGHRRRADVDRGGAKVRMEGGGMLQLGWVYADYCRFLGKTLDIRISSCASADLVEFPNGDGAKKALELSELLLVMPTGLAGCHIGFGRP